MWKRNHVLRVNVHMLLKYIAQNKLRLLLLFRGNTDDENNNILSKRIKFENKINKKYLLFL